MVIDEGTFQNYQITLFPSCMLPSVNQVSNYLKKFFFYRESFLE